MSASGVRVGRGRGRSGSLAKLVTQGSRAGVHGSEPRCHASRCAAQAVRAKYGPPMRRGQTGETPELVRENTWGSGPHIFAYGAINPSRTA